jgi:hypothetical protein
MRLVFVPILILEQIDSRGYDTSCITGGRSSHSLSLSSVSFNSASARFLRFFSLRGQIDQFTADATRLFFCRVRMCAATRCLSGAVQTHTYTSDGRHKSNGYACRDVHTIAVTCPAPPVSRRYLAERVENKRRERKTACVNVALFKINNGRKNSKTRWLEVRNEFGSSRVSCERKLIDCRQDIHVLAPRRRINDQTVVCVYVMTFSHGHRSQDERPRERASERINNRSAVRGSEGKQRPARWR